MSAKSWIILGALSAALAVALGAVGAHGLKQWLIQNFTPAEASTRLANWSTAAQYHRFHSLGLMVVGILQSAAVRERPSRLLNIAGWLMVAGIFLFSIALYVYSIAAFKWLGPVFPLGGFSYIIAWVLIAWASKSQHGP